MQNIINNIILSIFDVNIKNSKLSSVIILVSPTYFQINELLLIIS
jgi:hypothetical protein